MMYTYKSIKGAWYSHLVIVENIITFYFDGISNDDIDFFSDGLLTLEALCQFLHETPILVEGDNDHTKAHETGPDRQNKHTHYRFKTAITSEILSDIVSRLNGAITQKDKENLIRSFDAHLEAHSKSMQESAPDYHDLTQIPEHFSCALRSG